MILIHAWATEKSWQWAPTRWQWSFQVWEILKDKAPGRFGDFSLFTFLTVYSFCFLPYINFDIWSFALESSDSHYLLTFIYKRTEKYHVEDYLVNCGVASSAGSYRVFPWVIFSKGTRKFHVAQEPACPKTGGRTQWTQRLFYSVGPSPWYHWLCF